jgi:polysaccharide export outer membrane protein
MQRLLAIFAVFLTVQPLVGCTHLNPPPTYPHEDPAFAAAKGAQPGLDTDPPVPTVLMPGDTLTVRTISNQSEVYEGLVVDSEGKVHVPVIGPAQVSGLAPQQAERTIEGMMQKVDRFVRVNVLITEWGGHFATVIGAVVEEGTKTLSPGMRLAELIAAAGGPVRTTETTVTYFADLDGSRLVRDGQVVPVNLRLALNGDPRHNVFIHAGDQLFVPPGLDNRVAVFGNDQDRHGSMLVFRPGMRLTEAIAMGGGLNKTSDEEDIRIVRGNLKKPLVYRFDVDALVSGKTGDVEMAPGDVVYVTRHWSSVFKDVVDSMSPLITAGVSALNVFFFYKQWKTSVEVGDRQTQIAACSALTDEAAKTKCLMGVN